MSYYRIYIEGIVSHDADFAQVLEAQVYELPLTSDMMIPYTRYSEVAIAISTFSILQTRQLILPGKLKHKI
jgi:hypothetical protein